MTKPSPCGKKARVPDPLRVAIDTAAAVGELLRSHWKVASKVSHKGPIDTVRFIAHKCNSSNFSKMNLDTVKVTRAKGK